MLRTKLFRGFALLVVLFSVLSGFVGVRTITRRVLEEAQTRVRMDLSSARAIWNARLDEVITVMRLVAMKQSLIDLCETREWGSQDLRSRLERVRTTFGLDFLDLLSPDGQVMMRAAAPYHTGDYRATEPAVSAALKGQPTACMTLLTKDLLAQEAEGLAEKAFIELEDTPRARRTSRTVETRGMAMVAAAPVMKGSELLGAVFGGVLVNRNHALVDRIQTTLFEDERYRGMPVGTTTVFLMDCRIATTVLRQNGNRAIGTRVSKQVADSVLDNGRTWVHEAFVVRDWYLSAYEPIRNAMGEIIGMLYVGVLKRPYMDDARQLAASYVVVSLIALAASLALAFIVAGRIAGPIHRLVEASNRMSRGDRPPPVPTDNACDETETLIHSFNEMAARLAEREERLKGLNRSYMETLGFVSHELKSPVAAIMNYVYLLQQKKLGPVTEKQDKALRSIQSGSKRLVEMVRHYLNLSRIENGEMSPVRTRVDVGSDVVDPLLATAEADVEARHMRVANRIAAGMAVVHADLNMVREVFENLVSNAIKYGRDGGAIELGARADGERVAFSVRNEGPGIPADRIGDLFQKFSRIENVPGVHAQKGTGLGLFITRSIVEAHGGTIGVTSEKDGWTEFTFTLPAMPAAGGAGTGAKPGSAGTGPAAHG